MDREWLVDVTNIDNHKVALVSVLICLKCFVKVAAFPAIFYTILIVMDQQITAVIVNRKDNKLRVGQLYSSLFSLVLRRKAAVTTWIC